MVIFSNIHKNRGTKYILLDNFYTYWFFVFYFSKIFGICFYATIWSPIWPRSTYFIRVGINRSMVINIITDFARRIPLFTNVSLNIFFTHNSIRSRRFSPLHPTTPNIPRFSRFFHTQITKNWNCSTLFIASRPTVLRQHYIMCWREFRAFVYPSRFERAISEEKIIVTVELATIEINY